MGRRPDPAVRALILEQAERLIHLRGFHSTSLDDIARNCRMTKANLLHHYGSKEELGLAVFDAKIADYRKNRVDPLCCRRDPAANVRRLFEEATRVYNGNGCRGGCLVANIALEMSDLNEAFRGRASLFFSEWARGMGACLARAKKDGEFGRGLNPRAAAESIIALYEGAITMARATRDASLFHRVGQVACAILEQHRSIQRRSRTMGPKTPCGC